MHACAPTPYPVFVIDPTMHTLQKAWAATSWYSPGKQFAHTVELAFPAYLPAGHRLHADPSDVGEYVPEAHGLQTLAPALGPVFVIEPGWHSLQSLVAFAPTESANRPARHAIQDFTFDAVEYMPAAHCVHVVAPALLPVSVSEPAGQSMHDATSDLVEYFPALQAVHTVAPDAKPVSVIEPAKHASHLRWPLRAWCLPAGHRAQCCADFPLGPAYRPAPQAVHAELPFALQ